MPTTRLRFGAFMTPKETFGCTFDRTNCRFEQTSCHEKFGATTADARKQEITNPMTYFAQCISPTSSWARAGGFKVRGLCTAALSGGPTATSCPLSPESFVGAVHA